ncbi:MAG: hypothetical protein SOS24_04685 [Clostridia bacterium]|nr:hypothetical protein [Clostridia bacterium]
MKNNFEKPEIKIVAFYTEKVVTTSGATNSNTYRTTMENIVGENKLVQTESQVFAFTF